LALRINLAYNIYGTPTGGKGIPTTATRDVFDTYGGIRID